MSDNAPDKPIVLAQADLKEDFDKKGGLTRGWEWVKEKLLGKNEIKGELKVEKITEKKTVDGKEQDVDTGKIKVIPNFPDYVGITGLKYDIDATSSNFNEGFVVVKFEYNHVDGNGNVRNETIMYKFNVADIKMNKNAAGTYSNMKGKKFERGN